MPRKYVRVTGNTRCTRVYSKQPKWSVGTITGPSNSPPQRNTQIINVPIVSCPSIFKFHRLSPDPTTMYPPKIYKNFTIFAFQKKKKKRKHRQKCRTHLAPEIGIPLGHRFIYTTIDIKKLIQPGQIILDLRIKGSEIPRKLANRCKRAKKRRHEWIGRRASDWI